MALEDQLRRVAGWAGLIVAAAAIYIFLSSALPQPIPVVGQTVAHPAVALTLIFLGCSLWLQLHAKTVVPGIICAVAGLLLAIGIALESEFGLNLYLHGWFAREGLAGGTARASTHSGALLILAAAAIIALCQQRHRLHWPISAWLTNFVIALSAAALLGSLHSQDPLDRPIHVTTDLAAALLVLGVATMLARPDDKHIRVLFAHNAAGVLSRRLFLAVAVLPVVFGFALIWFVTRARVEAVDGVLLLVAAIIVSGFLVALFSIDTAAGISQGREEAENARLLLTARLQEQTVKLQEIVNQRTRELRDANASLRATAESNALLALVAQNTTSGVVITNGEGEIEWVNTAFSRITGYELAEIKGRKPGHVLQGPDTDPATVEKMRQAVHHGQACHVEVLNYTKQGRPFWHTVDIQPVRERSGRVVNFVANLTDITTERADKIRLEQLSQRLKLATRAAELGIWEWDAATRHAIWDNRLLEMYGLTAAQFHGTAEDWLARVHPDDRDLVKAREQSILEGANSYQHEFRIIRGHDGETRHLASSAIAERDSQGRLLRIVGTDRDITATRESTRQLQSLNERLQLALRSSKYGVWEYDVTNARHYWDDRVLEIYGLRRETFDGTPAAWLQTFHPEDAVAIQAQTEQVIGSDASDYEMQFRILRPDGTVRHVETHGYVQRDDAGRAVRLVGLSRDITESKHLEQALALAEQRWQLAIEGTNDSVWDWDVTTGHVYHDERWSRLLGYESSELDHTIDGWKALAHPEDLAANEVEIQEHFAQRTPFYCHELRMRAKDGSWRWILDRGKVVQRAGDGRPLRMVGTHSDITERRELEERLRKTEQLAQEVSRIAQIGGWEIDLITSRVTWNEGTRRIHEADDKFQPTLDGIWQFFPPDALATVQSALRDSTPEQPSFDVEIPMHTARGRRIWVRMLGHGEFTNGRATSVRGAIQDITGRHESEEARRELEAQLFQAQKMETLGTLAGGIAHDFNNLLTGIIGYHELAADSVPEDHPARECLAEARNASLRARELVEQILTFGRQSSSAEHVPVDLVNVIEEARRFLRATLPANISLDVNCAPHCGTVLGDATQIHQVILNLGSNAAHAMRQHGGTIKIALEPAEVTPDLALTLGSPAANSYVRLSVSDTGHGMDESTRRRIFDPFFTTKNTREGTGLGLAVVHGIVRTHRGAIDVESTPGRGATFHVYLPTVAADNAEEGETPDSAPRGEGEFVCVVDDEEVVGSCTKLVLESQGYQSLIFSSAEQCLAHLQANPAICSVLVTDQTMPGMQGTELAAALRRLRPNLPVVIMSGYFSKISPQALDELGQIELLAKPFTTDELAHAVHRALHPAERLV
jgi:PAS domain S-box-containing protein